MNREAIERLIYIRDNLCDSVEDKVAIEIALTESDCRRWHDLKEDPEDFPEDLEIVYVKRIIPTNGDTKFSLAYYNHDTQSWYELYSHITILNAVGWRYVYDQ